MKIQSHALEDLKIGQNESSARLVTSEMINAFADVSGDKNPIHIDADYAATTPFKERIAHGALTASFISAVLGTQLPGDTAVALNLNVNFKRPVKIGDTVHTTVTVIDIDTKKRHVRFATDCVVGKKKVVDGEALVYVRKK